MGNPILLFQKSRIIEFKYYQSWDLFTNQFTDTGPYRLNISVYHMYNCLNFDLLLSLYIS